MLIKKNATVLFQGDSITDAGRDRENDTLGDGYPRYVAAMFTAAYPELGVKFINRGISGNRTTELLERWDEDCLALKPDVLSILIGINDIWRQYDSDMVTTTEQFYDNYYKLLSSVKKEIGDIPIIMMEPFLLPFIADKVHWRTALDPEIYAARKIAREFGAVYIPLDGIFASRSITVEPTVWSEDGVHPTQAGHALIAQLWLEAAQA